MLLLLVLLALSLFLAVGVMLITVGVRARLSARAHGDARFGSNAYDTVLTQVLDEALMTALRGSSSVTNPAERGSVRPYVSASSGALVFFESVLHDKFGLPITGTAIGMSGFDTSVITLTLARSSLSPAEAANSPGILNGRILTMRPNSPGMRHRSFRILGSATSGPSSIQCFLANAPSAIAESAPSGECGVIINGREFTPTPAANSPEPSDAYDDANLWLAHPVLEKGQVVDFSRLSFSGTALSGTTPVSRDLLADNDNDGLEDGAWFPCGSPQRSPLGGNLRFDVSYLILDLDGRININAAGMARTGTSGYSTTPADAPLGAGYGPADIDASLLFPATILSSATSPSGTAASRFALSGTSAFNAAYTQSNLTLSGSVAWETWLPANATSGTRAGGTAGTPAKWPTLLISGLTAAGPEPYQRRFPLSTGLVIGRYGPNRLPGIAGDDVNQPTNAGSYISTVAGTNSTADLQGRSRMFTEPPVTSGTPAEIMPRLTHFVPATSADWADDPYESRLDGISTADDTPFTLAEFERVLRADDSDANELPHRLAAALGDLAQVSRMTFTTDSWDSPALSGSAARVIEQALSGTVPIVVATSGSARNFRALVYSGSTSWRSTSGTANPMSPDIAAGLRFNLNRPVTTPEERHEYCKGLYTLALVLNGTTGNTAPFRRAVAQWAVNALDFRDEDSDCTGFEYDDDISDGWNVDGNLATTAEPTRGAVWGAERPDLIITQAGAWRASTSDPWRAIVTLHHPAHVADIKSVVSGSLATTGTVGRVHAAFTSGTGVDLRKRPAANADPIWRLRLSSDGSTQLAQFVSSTAAGIVTSSSNASPLQLDSNQYVCLHATGSSPFTPAAVPGFFAWPMDSGGTFGFANPSATSGTVAVLRLASGTAPFHADTNPYIEMDSAPLTPLTGTNSFTRRLVFSGTTAIAAGFWPNHSPWDIGIVPIPFGPYAVSGTNRVQRFHWPNRPFISQAELALVPTGTSGTSAMSTNHALMNYGNTIFSLVAGTSGTVTPAASLLLDATYVPTRFAGCVSSGTGPDIDRLGFSLLGTPNLPSWREPGKVNVNTVVTGTAAQDPGPDNIVWSTLISSSTPNPFVGTPRIRARPEMPASGALPLVPAISATSAVTGTAAASLTQLLSLSTGGTTGVFTDPSALASGTGARSGNPYFQYAKAIGLANTATIRSNVFAIWVSVRVTDDSPNAPPPVVKRVFAIVDRSIPVGYSPGEDLNVQECIRLKRYLD
jgi:hypothetical protein